MDSQGQRHQLAFPQASRVHPGALLLPRTRYESMIEVLDLQARVTNSKALLKTYDLDVAHEVKKTDRADIKRSKRCMGIRESG